MKLSTIIKKVVEVYKKYIKPIIIELIKEKPFSEPHPVVKEQPTEAQAGVSKHAIEIGEMERGFLSGKKALNLIATKLITYIKLTESYKGTTPTNFTMIPELFVIYEAINLNLTGRALKKVVNLFASKTLEKDIGHNEWVLELVKGDPNFPYADFQMLTEIVERQRGILNAIKSSEDRIKRQLQRFQEKENEIHDKYFKSRQTQ